MFLQLYISDCLVFILCDKNVGNVSSVWGWGSVIVGVCTFQIVLCIIFSDENLWNTLQVWDWGF